jgi:hypothetical protein
MEMSGVPAKKYCNCSVNVYFYLICPEKQPRRNSGWLYVDMMSDVVGMQPLYQTGWLFVPPLRKSTLLTLFA